jgi:predicted DNA-binding protein YlxM (UPF0122 family)
MEEIMVVDITDLFMTCNTIVYSDIKGHCNAILEKLNQLIPMSHKKGQKKKLKKLKKKVKKIAKIVRRR